MRITTEALAIKAHRFQNFDAARPASGRRRVRLVNCQRFRDDAGDGHPRIQRRDRILKNHLHAPAQFAQFRSARAQPIFAPKINFAGIGLDQTQQHARQRGFAAAGFADDAQSFAALHRETHSIDGHRLPSRPGQHSARNGIRFSQVACFEQNFGGHS